MQWQGSSPLARGTPANPTLGMLGARLIPARAGNTNQAPLTLCSHSAHPRSRGEHAPGSEGSRPPPSRLIPARAGSTLMLGHVLLVRRAHPRSRGEHYHKQAKQMRDRDSSPLARGTRSPAAPLHRNARLIPARAGNTYTPGVTVNAHSAHPRSRGEHNPSLTLIGAVIGSSPLARGTPAARSVSKPQLRLIPARAGNTDCSDWLSPRAPAHPRSRGEHSGAITSPSAMVGSSPLARGTRAAEERQRIRFRLIPARAGNTPCRVPGRSGYPAHPRSRGEHGSPARESQ